MLRNKWFGVRVLTLLIDPAPANFFLLKTYSDKKKINKNKQTNKKTQLTLGSFVVCTVCLGDKECERGGMGTIIVEKLSLVQNVSTFLDK